MRVAHLSLVDFRNYRSAEVPFAPGPNLVLGRNGQGKTNLVEAIAYFASLSSHRVSSDSALIRAGAEAAVARMKILVGEREALLELQLNRDRPNRAQLNRNGVPPREITRWFSTVVFAPEDLMIVRGDPSVRRRFLDEAIVARNPGLAGVLTDYDRVVRQRTALLKSARATGNRAALESTLEVWNEQLVDHGSRIMVARQALVADLLAPLRSGYEAIVQQDHRPSVRLIESVAEVARRDVRSVSRETSAAGIDTRTVSRETPGSVSPPRLVSRETVMTEFRSSLASVKQQELDRGMTLIGPHRDDALFELNNLPVKGYASHGESWSFALSLRLALASLLREESPAGDPVIVLDDVFAELDESRRSRLMLAVGDFEQVIVTAAVEADVPNNTHWHRVGIEAGTVVEVSA